MSDLISRQAAIDALERIFDRCEEIEAHFPEGDPDRIGYKMFPDYQVVWKFLHQLPSAQPEIIRCKDCNKASKCFGNVHMITRGGGYICCHLEFCSEAERRTNGEN